MEMMQVRNFRKTKLVLFAGLIAALSMSSCSLFKRDGKSPEPVIFEIGPRTTRADILRQVTVALNSFGYLIEYSDRNKDYAALITEWRQTGTDVDDPELQEMVQTRDRAMLHLSPRGYQGDRVSLVVSKLQFEVQVKVGDDDAWTTIAAPAELVREYKEIIDVVRRRLSLKGYKF